MHVRVALLLALLLAVPASAEVLVFEGETYAEVGPGGEAELQWVAVSADNQGHFLLATVDVDGRDWSATVEPAYAQVEPGGEIGFTVLVVPGADPSDRATITLVLEEPDTNATMRQEGHVDAVGFGMVLGLIDNPLPWDGPWSLFAANLVGWLVVSLLVMLLVNPTLRLATMRTKTTVDDRVIKILSRPAFVLLFSFGVKESLEVFAMPRWAVAVLHQLWFTLLIFILALVAYRLWHEVLLALGQRWAKKSESQLDDRLLPVFEKLGGLAIWIVGLFYVLDSLGANMAWLAAGGAVGGLVIAFAAQDTLANFFSGFHILLDQPFQEGDDIILDSGEICTVKKIGLRSTDLYHAANHEVIVVPNSLLATNRVINLLQPDNRYKVKILVGVAYGTDVQLVKRLLLEVAREHPLSLDEEGHAPFVRFNDFGASSLDFAVHVWISDVYARWAIASDLREMIDRSFADHGIEIPFPQRVIWDGRKEADLAIADQMPSQGREGLDLHDDVDEARQHQDDGGDGDV